jgi:molybdopterin-guanine dinucleotide biosynthesis protein A
MSAEQLPATAASAIVLAGGEARRFGGPKLATLVDGVSLLERAVVAVAGVAAEVIVVARPGDAPTLPTTLVAVHLVHDPEADGGPLVGLAAGLRFATRPAAIVVGGDMPRLRPEVLALMLERLAGGGCVAVLLGSPDPGSPRQPLPMAVAVAPALEAADAALAAGRRSLLAMLDALAGVDVPAAEWLHLDPGAGTLVDIDEPADLERLARPNIDHADQEDRT